MRFNNLLSREQVSFKNRNRKVYKKVKLNYGNFGFISLKNIQFEYVYFFFIKRFLKYFFKFKYSLGNYFKVWVFLKGNFPISKKSKNSRMGKGKGSFSRWLIKLNEGHTIMEFKSVPLLRLKKLQQSWNKTLGFNIIIYKKINM